MVNDVECEEESFETGGNTAAKSGNNYNIFRKKTLPSLADCWRW